MNSREDRPAREIIDVVIRGTTWTEVIDLHKTIGSMSVVSNCANQTVPNWVSLKDPRVVGKENSSPAH